MQLHRTRIAIRERKLLEILDLSLKVGVDCARPLLVYSAVLVLPLMLWNWWLLGRIPVQEGDASAARYLWLMAQLVFIEAPLGTALATLFLGKAMFLERFSWREMMAEFFKLLSPLLWHQFVLRGVALAWLVAAMIGWTSETTLAEMSLPILVCCLFVVRAVRPFVNEIVLLERTPVRSASDGGMTVGRRSMLLHRPNTGDLFARWLSCSALVVLMTVSATLAVWSLRGMVLFDWSWGPIMVRVVVPLTMWIVAVYLSVVRFLCYLDLRIRREGWEVELMLRAAATRLARQVI